MKARADADLFSAPEKPHIGFLLAHYAVAVNRMAKAVPSQVAAVMERYRAEMISVQREPAGSPSVDAI